MPRDLYHLEGQQLRGLLRRAEEAHSHLHGVAVPIVAVAALVDLETIIKQILADGPHSRDEDD
jgi:hypothetical protein